MADVVGEVIAAAVEWLLHKLPRGCVILFAVILAMGLTLLLVFLFAR